MNLQYTLVGHDDGSKALTVIRPGEKPLQAHSSHPNFDAIIRGLLENDSSIVDLFDVSLTVGTKFEKLTERVSVANGMIFLDGESMDDSLTQQIIRFMQEGIEDWKPLVKFYENMASNPNPLSVTELYAFIGANNITISEDGMLVGYKGLSAIENPNGYKFESSSEGKAIVDGTVYEGHIPQDVGSVVEMPRGDVEYDPGRDCGIGLHVGNFSYAKTYAKPGFFEVHVNPRDVVSVPSYGTKLRCCRYVVAKVSTGEEETKPVVEADPTNTVPVGKKKQAKVNRGDVYRDRDPRRPRDLKVLAILGGMARVQNLKTEKIVLIKASRLQSRFDRIRRGR